MKASAWRRVIFLCGLFCLPTVVSAVEIWGIDVKGLEVNASVMLIRNSVGDSAPDPMVNAVGVSVPFKFLSYLTFRQEASLFLTTYGYQNGRAIPLESMFDSVMMMAINLNSHFGAEFPITEFLQVGGELGLAFINRVPVFFLGKTGIDLAGPVSGYFIAGRFLYPNLSAGASWQFSELLALTGRLEYYYPLFNLWNNVPYWDQMMFDLNFGLRFTF